MVHAMSVLFNGVLEQVRDRHKKRSLTIVEKSISHLLRQEQDSMFGGASSSSDQKADALPLSGTEQARAVLLALPYIEEEEVLDPRVHWGPCSKWISEAAANLAPPLILQPGLGNPHVSSAEAFVLIRGQLQYKAVHEASHSRDVLVRAGTLRPKGVSILI